jgi:3-deoxy-D-manno-octulosonic-acid transferase
MLYQHAIVAFVGGTLVPVGGHNLLEPAMWGKPVFFGTHTDHCLEMADLLIRAGGGRPVQDGNELVMEMARVLRDRQALERMGTAAKQVVIENRGALARTLEVIGRLLHWSERAVHDQPSSMSASLAADKPR